MVAEALERASIDFIHESEDKEMGLDFYLPVFNVYLEVKQFHAERINRQLTSQDNVIVLQGRKAVEFFIRTLQTKPL
jgi:hypothetical protein